MKIVGLDISQTASGIAIHEPGGLTWVTEAGEDGHKTDSLYQRHARMRRTARAIVAHAADADLVVVESHSFSAKYGNQHDRSGLWWDVVGELIDGGVDVAEASPSTLKMYLTGSGNASKDLMLATAVRRYPTVNVLTNDQADAMAALSMGVRRLELMPLEDTWNQKMSLAMGKVQWP